MCSAHPSPPSQQVKDKHRAVIERQPVAPRSAPPLQLLYAGRRSIHSRIHSRRSVVGGAGSLVGQWQAVADA